MWILLSECQLLNINFMFKELLYKSDISVLNISMLDYLTKFTTMLIFNTTAHLAGMIFLKQIEMFERFPYFLLLNNIITFKSKTMLDISDCILQMIFGDVGNSKQQK